MRVFLLAWTVALLVGQAASSAIMTYDNVTAFLEAAGPTEFEDFEDVPGERNFTDRTRNFGDFSLRTDLTPDPGSDLPRDLASFNRILIGPQANYPTDFQEAAASNSIDGSSNFAHIGLKETDVFTIVFSEPMYSFGADFKGLNDTYLRTRFSIGGTEYDASVTDGNQLRFLGFVSDTPFTYLSITGRIRTQAPDVDSDGFGMDNLRYSSMPPPTTEIPVPASLPLMATGLALFGLYARRARRPN